LCSWRSPLCSSGRCCSATSSPFLLAYYFAAYFYSPSELQRLRTVGIECARSRSRCSFHLAVSVRSRVGATIGVSTVVGRRLSGGVAFGGGWRWLTLGGGRCGCGSCCCRRSRDAIGSPSLMPSRLDCLSRHSPWSLRSKWYLWLRLSVVRRCPWGRQPCIRVAVAVGDGIAVAVAVGVAVAGAYASI